MHGRYWFQQASKVISGLFSFQVLAYRPAGSNWSVLFDELLNLPRHKTGGFFLGNFLAMAAKKSEVVTIVEGKPEKPWIYDEKIAEEVLQRLVNGETLTSICRDIGLKPYHVYGWTMNNEAFGQRFARAREFGDLVIEDQAIDASDARCVDEEISETETEKSVGRSRKKFDNVARSRLMAETRLKVVARRKGAKITNEIRIAKKTEADQAAEMTTDQLLEIAKMSVEEVFDGEAKS